MPDADHSHLSDSQRDVLRSLGWRSPSERRAAARRLWWRKTGFVLALAAAVLIALKVFGTATGASERMAPESWDCSACTAEWAGYDFAAEHDFVTPQQCGSGMSDRQRLGCLTYVRELEIIEPRDL